MYEELLAYHRHKIPLLLSRYEELPPMDSAEVFYTYPQAQPYIRIKCGKYVAEQAIETSVEYGPKKAFQAALIACTQNLGYEVGIYSTEGMD